ncbi:hypothetical protein PFISCL1PPCAC_5785, partial [Pristionchus fissidentatus]
LLLFLLIPLSFSLKCTHCPPLVSSPSQCSQCEGHVCFIVVNVFFNGTLSAGCIDLLDKDRNGFVHTRKECNREVTHDRTVCVCNTGDHCNDPKTPLAEFDFISNSVLSGYNLQPGVTLTTAEPRAELPTDETHLIESEMMSSTPTTTSETLSIRSSTAVLPRPSSDPPTTTSTTTNNPIPLVHRLSSTRKPRIDDEEELIQVKSSVFIKPRNQSRIVPSSSEMPSLAPSTTTPRMSEIARVLPTDDAIDLSGVYRVKGMKSDGKVLPTDSDEEEEGILVVKSGVMRVKEKEEKDDNRIEKNTETPTVEMKNTVRQSMGEGSVQEAEV